MGYEYKAGDLAKMRKKKALQEREWYNLRSLLGYDWAMFYFLLGGRETGKSYATTDFFVHQWRRYKRPFYWLRLTEASQKKLLQNNAEKLIDPALKRKYNLDIVTSGENVYEVIERDEKGKIKKKELMARVMALSTFYNDKGSGLFDQEFLDNPNMYYNICLDEMNREANEKNSFDIVYAFVNQLENLVRSTKERIRVICIGNTLQEASDLLCAFNFIPDNFGRFKLKKKRAVIEYMAPNEAYKERRKGTIADIVSPESSTFTNEVAMDRELLCKERLKRPISLIMFTKERGDWFTVWESQNGKIVIAKYNKENVKNVYAMRGYLDKFFDKERKQIIIDKFNNRSFLFRDLSTQKMFQRQMKLLKPNA